MALNSSINITNDKKFQVRIGSLYGKTENESKEALSEMDQKGRNLLFNGDSIDKKQLKIDQHRFRTEKKERRDHRRLMRTEEKI